MNLQAVLKIIPWSVVHAMKCVIKTTEILVGAMCYLSHMKEQALPLCGIVSSQCSFGRAAAVCPHLEKGAVHSLSVLKNSVLLNLKIIGCHQTKAGINWKIKALFLSVSHNLFCCLVAVVYAVAS